MWLAVSQDQVAQQRDIKVFEMHPPRPKLCGKYAQEAHCHTALRTTGSHMRTAAGKTRVDAEVGMPQGEPCSAKCVQNSVGSRCSAFHNAYHTSLRPSSLLEPRHPSLKAVISSVRQQSCHEMCKVGGLHYT